MTFGTKLKSLRTERNFSQPELAAKIGIEQSYLSKLENDKSVPSSEMLMSILQTFDMSLDILLSDPQIKPDLVRLKQIPDVEHWLRQRDQASYHRQRQLLYASSLLVAIAVTLFYTGYSKVLYQNVYYQYSSLGVIQQGEPNHVFSHWRNMMSPDSSADDVRKKAQEMMLRRDEVTLLSEHNRGSQFVLTVKDGNRLYRYDKEIYQHRSENALLQISGVFLFVLGLMGFILERRLPR